MGGAPENRPLTWALTKSKHQLLDHAHHICPVPKYNIQKIADKFATEDFSINILLLVVAHTELNPNEIVWEFVKIAVASRNIIFMLAYVEELERKQLNEVTAAIFKKF